MSGSPQNVSSVSMIPLELETPGIAQIYTH
jgi:hypothetical protein